MHTNITIITAFLGGLVSFLSPCMLPIVPGFLAYLAGSSLSKAEIDRKEIFLNAFFFVIGFSTIFAATGVLFNSLFDAFAYDAQVALARLGGLVVIFFGLFLTGIFRLSFLQRDYQFYVKAKLSSRYATSFLFGLAFAAGWTPCIGPVLGALLALAATQPSSAFALLFAYGLGLGIPFLVVGAFAAQASALINRYAGVLRYVSIAFGILLIVFGFLIFTQQLNRIADFPFPRILWGG